MDFYSENDIILDFIDEDSRDQNRIQKRLSIQFLRDQSQINFDDLLQRQWTVTDQSQQFFHSNSKLPQQIIPQLLQGNKIPSFKSRKKLNFISSDGEKTVQSQQQMKNIFTIFQSPEQVEDIQMYLASDTFVNFIRIVVILNFVGLFMTDYGFRLKSARGEKTEIQYQNAVSLNLQTFANCVFTIQIILQLFSSKIKFTNPWIILNIIGTFACWASIFFDMIQNDKYVIFQVLHILRILRGIRIIEVFQELKHLFQIFLGTVPSLKKIFFPLLVFMSFYAITGQHLFLGSNQHKCRVTQHPVNGTWSQTSWDLCGAGMWNCPKDTFCKNPYDYGLPNSQIQQGWHSKQYGLVGFNDFFRAMLTVYHYVFLSNWTSIIFKFSKYINPYVTTFYFVSMAIVLFYILANLIFVSLSKAYLEQEKIQQKKRQNTFNQNNDMQNGNEAQVKQQILSAAHKYVLKIVQIFEVVLIIVQCVVIVIDYKGMSQQLKRQLNLIDFITTVVAIVVVFIRFYILRLRLLKDFHNIVDSVMLICFITNMLYCLSNNYSIVDTQEGLNAVLRGMKIIRVIKILYVSESILKYERNIVNLFFLTLKNMRFFLLLLVCIVMIFSFIGEMLFAFRVRFNSNRQVDIQNGRPYITNFDSAYKSIISTVLLFQNQRWTQTMYTYYHARGFWGILFFASVAFFVHLMLTRLFMAVFLCYFRRDLEKKFEEKERQKSLVQTQEIVGKVNPDKMQQLTIIQEFNENKSKTQSQTLSNQFQQQQQNSRKQQKTSPQTNCPPDETKIFWFLNKNSCMLQIIRIFHDSKAFYYITLIAVILHVITIVFRSNVDSSQKTKALDSFQNISISIYCLQVILGVLSYGFYFQKNSYLKRTHFNKLNFIVVILLIFSVMPFINLLHQLIIRRFIVIKVFTVLKKRNKEMDIILKAFTQIFKNFLRIVVIYFFFILMASIIPLKLLKNSLYNCYNSYLFQNSINPQNPVDCMNAGGDWVQDSQNFNNIFNAVVLMYQIVTSESWTYFIELTVTKNIHWDIFFVLIFFFYNVCLLNIFVGLTIQTYIDLKDKAYRLNLLKPSQKGWILIKNCINQLLPQPTIGSTTFHDFPTEVSFKIISHEYYNILIDVLAYINIVLYALTIYRSSQEYQNILLYLKISILIIFSIDTLLKLYALRWEYFYLDNSKVQLMGFVYTLFYGLMATVQLTNQQQRIVDFCLVICLYLRCKKFLFRFTWSKTLINSVIQILPKCIQIGSFLFIVLFVYVAIGLQIFKHVKPTSKSDGYSTGFNDFYTGVMTLLKIASNQSWFDQVTAYIRDKTSNDICFHITTQQQADKHSGMGCGSWMAIPFFLTYHMVMALLILNLLIATMISAYDQNYEKQYNSVNVFQLQDCLQLWKKYDPKGTGVIPYKKFWKLSSEIGILFGISKKKLIKSKQKFLQQLDIPICQSINPEDSSVLCYRFHDVITKFSKIKLQVSLDKGDQNGHSIQFDIHPLVENQIKDFTTKIPQQLYKNYKQFKSYTSGQMKYFFGLLRKLRSWKTHSKSKGQIKVSKLSRIIKIAMEKKVKEENLKNLLAFSNGNDAQLVSDANHKKLNKKQGVRAFSNQNKSGSDQRIISVNKDQNDNISNYSQSSLVQSQPIDQQQNIGRNKEGCFHFDVQQKQDQTQKKEN